MKTTCNADPIRHINNSAHYFHLLRGNGLETGGSRYREGKWECCSATPKIRNKVGAASRVFLCLEFSYAALCYETGIETC